MKVYFTKDISSKGLLNIYKSLNKELKGRVAVKISTGEPGGHNFLNPNLIKDLVDELDGTIVENCTAYRGRRFEVKDHYQAIEEHGFNIFKCDIMDEDGEIEIPVSNGTHLKGINIVGSHIKNYDSMLMLSHFKGHAMGGFGGALKNMSIGVASRNGKAWIHSVGITKDPDEAWNHIDDQDGFLESMAEADKAVVDYYNGNMLFINVMNNISIDCDCDSNPHKPEMKDIGILASLDPVALDQCCYDLIINSNDPGKESLINRMNEKHAIHTVEWAEKLGVGTRKYELENIDNNSLNEEGFDSWASTYDDTVIRNSNSYPFDKYYEGLYKIYNMIDNGSVLDIGFGTGTLTKRLYDKGLDISGIDFSNEMIKIAKSKMTNAKLYHYDFNNGLPEGIGKFNYIISTYAMHHLKDEDKIVFINNLKNYLLPNGKIIILDIAFNTLAEHNKCMNDNKSDWDSTEYYIVWDKLKDNLKDFKYEQISSCSGMITL